MGKRNLISIYEDVYKKGISYCALCYSSYKETRLVKTQVFKKIVEAIRSDIVVYNEKLCYICEAKMRTVLYFLENIQLALKIYTVFRTAEASTRKNFTQKRKSMQDSLKLCQKKFIKFKKKIQLKRSETMIVDNIEPEKRPQKRSTRLEYDSDEEFTNEEIKSTTNKITAVKKQKNIITIDIVTDVPPLRPPRIPSPNTEHNKNNSNITITPINNTKTKLTSVDNTDATEIINNTVNPTNTTKLYNNRKANNTLTTKPKRKTVDTITTKQTNKTPKATKEPINPTLTVSPNNLSYMPVLTIDGSSGTPETHLSNLPLLRNLLINNVNKNEVTTKEKLKIVLPTMVCKNQSKQTVIDLENTKSIYEDEPARKKIKQTPNIYIVNNKKYLTIPVGYNNDEINKVLENVKDVQQTNNEDKSRDDDSILPTIVDCRTDEYAFGTRNEADKETKRELLKAEVDWEDKIPTEVTTFVERGDSWPLNLLKNEDADIKDKVNSVIEFDYKNNNVASKDELIINKKTCDICAMEINSSTIKDHFIKMHVKQTDIFCGKCHMKFSSMINLSEHLKFLHDFIHDKKKIEEMFQRWKAQVQAVEK